MNFFLTVKNLFVIEFSGERREQRKSARPGPSSTGRPFRSERAVRLSEHRPRRRVRPIAVDCSAVRITRASCVVER